jgi:hypothetical protein
MTILFASGEDTGFTLIGAAVGATTPAGCSRSGYARSTACGVGANNGTIVADPPANRFQTPIFTAGNLVWVHAQFFNATDVTTTNNQQTLLLRSPDGVSRIVLRQTGTAGTFKVSSRNAAGAFTDLATATGVFTLNTITQLDLKVDYSASGGVQLYLAGTLVINYSGDPRTDAATQLDQVEFSGAGFNGNQRTVWSEMIIADEDTTGMALWTMTPQAAGATQSWTPNTLANINKAVINDSTLITTATANALSEWTAPTAVPAGTWNVKAVVQEARVERGATGPQHFDWQLRVSATDYAAGASNAPVTSFGNFSNYSWPTNPATSAAWITADLTTGIQYGIKSLT